MLAVSVCHGNCAACNIKKAVSVNKVARQVVEQRMVTTVMTEDPPVKEEPVSIDEPVVTATPVTEADPLIKEEPAVETGLALYEPSEQVETYKIAKTRKGFLGKLVGGIA